MGSNIELTLGAVIPFKALIIIIIMEIYRALPSVPVGTPGALYRNIERDPGTVIRSTKSIVKVH